MKKTALFVARFQPLHKGHVYALKQLLKKYNVIIGIGSINRKDRNNPFSYKERKRMVESVLSKYKGKYKIIGIKDYADNKKWTREVEKKARFDVVVSGNALVKYCFGRYGTRDYVIKNPSFLRPHIYDASRIRKLIRRKLSWERLVPKRIAAMIGRWWRHA